MAYDGRYMPAWGTYIGKHAAFEEYFPKMLSSFAEFHASDNEYLNAGDSVIVLGNYSGRSKSGIEFESPFARVYAVKKGKIVSFRHNILILPRSGGF